MILRFRTRKGQTVVLEGAEAAAYLKTGDWISCKEVGGKQPVNFVPQAKKQKDVRPRSEPILRMPVGKFRNGWDRGRNNGGYRNGHAQSG